MLALDDKDLDIVDRLRDFSCDVHPCFFILFDLLNHLLEVLHLLWKLRVRREVLDVHRLAEVLDDGAGRLHVVAEDNYFPLLIRRALDSQRLICRHVNEVCLEIVPGAETCKHRFIEHE